MAEKRTSKLITDKQQIDYFLNLKEEDITTSMIMDCFGEFNGKSKFNPYDLIEIPVGYYGPENKKNKNKFKTTIGIWIFNKYFIEKRFFHLFGYINKSITSKVYGSINSDLSYALMEDKITIEDLKDFIMKCQKCMPYVSILSPNHTLKMLTCTKEIDKKKKELIKKYDKEIKAGDEVAVEKMENELMDFAKELLGDDPSLDMYSSGARGSFGNNFKNMFIMKGAIKDPDPLKGYSIATSNYMDGISKEEYTIFANSLAAGPYSRAKKTEIGGYWEKLFLSAFQHIVLDAPGSDCGTKRYITVDVTEKNIDSIMYCYAIEGSRLIEITSDNKDRFIGNTVKIRFSSMCESKTGICNKCAGNLFYRLGIRNIGTATPQIASKLKVTSMKAFHDSQVTTVEMDPEKAFGIKM